MRCVSRLVDPEVSTTNMVPHLTCEEVIRQILYLIIFILLVQ